MTRLMILWQLWCMTQPSLKKKKKGWSQLRSSAALDPGTLIFAVRALAGSTRKWKHCIILAVEVLGVLQRIPKPHCSNRIYCIMSIHNHKADTIKQTQQDCTEHMDRCRLTFVLWVLWLHEKYYFTRKQELLFCKVKHLKFSDWIIDCEVWARSNPVTQSRTARCQCFTPKHHYVVCKLIKMWQQVRISCHS